MVTVQELSLIHIWRIRQQRLLSARPISLAEKLSLIHIYAYQVTVSVKNGTTSGKLTVSVDYNSGAINFTNIYNASGSLNVTATKTVEGRNDVLNIFKFDLYKLVGEKEEYLQTATNNGSQISFTIPYTVAKDKDKTYTYIPVSYTHLDVYKRQVFRRKKKSGF